MFAGDEVRLNPFHTCTSLRRHHRRRATAAAVRCQAPGRASGVGPSAAVQTPGSEHHRPWCPHRRSPDTATHVRLILAHELETEALRILIPAVTALVEERLVSFAAALRLGIAAQYGGDPAHLRVVRAPMPEPGTTT